MKDRILLAVTIWMVVLCSSASITSGEESKEPYAGPSAGKDNPMPSKSITGVVGVEKSGGVTTKQKGPPQNGISVKRFTPGEKLKKDEKTGPPEITPSSKAGLHRPPRGKISKEEVEPLTRKFLSENRDELDIEDEDLDLEKSDYSPPLYEGQTDGMWQVVYQQKYNGIPVYKSSVGFTIIDGKLVSLKSRYHPGIDISVIPALKGGEANNIVAKDLGTSVRPEENTLVIFPNETDAGYEYFLAYRLELPVIDVPFGAWVYFVDAHTGEIIHKYDRIVYSQISGNVEGMVIPEYPSQTQVAVNFSNETVNIEQGGSTVATNTTDASGDYSVFGLSGSVDVVSELKGPYVDVENNAQADASHSYTISVVPDTHSWNWDTDDTSYFNEESNMFHHVNLVHDFFTKGGSFNITSMNYQMTATVEVSGYCNAYATGTNIYFYGPGGGCNATSLLSDVIYHEYTHNVHMHVHPDLTPYWGEPGGMMEGWGDYFAGTINNDSCMGEEFFTGSSECLRDLNHTKRYPDDYGSGEPHGTGEIFGGALWDVRVALGQALADDLIIRSMKMQAWTWTEYLTDMLIADDDNGDLSDGTPHKGEICGAFYTNHGIYSPYCDSFTYLATYRYSNDTDVSIPDGSGSAISTITVPGGGIIKNVFAYVGISHTYKGNLNVNLTSPDGTSVRLHSMSGGSDDNISTWYDNETLPDGPGHMNDFNGGASAGTWILNVSDTKAGYTGNIDTFSLELYIDGITIQSPKNQSYLSGDLDFNMSVSWPLYPNGAWFSVDGPPNVSMTNDSLYHWYNVSYPTLPERTHNATFWANFTDMGLFSYTVWFTVDLTPPNMTINLPGNTTYNTSYVKFDITSSEALNTSNKVVVYNVDTNSALPDIPLAGDSTTHWYNYTAPYFDNALYNATFEINDTAGNSNSSTIWFTVAGPDINVTPLEINETFYQGNTTVKNITIKNTGPSPLEFNLTEVGFSRDMESVTDDWTHYWISGSNIPDNWNLSAGRSKSTSHSWYSGEEVATWNNGGDTAIETPYIILIGATNATLSFWHWYYFDGSSGFYPDGGVVEIKTQNGSWTQISPVGGYDNNITTEYDNPLEGAPAFTYLGGASGWVREEFDLSGYLGNSVKIRFHVGWDFGTFDEKEGWYIDDVVVTTVGGWVSISPKNGTLPGINETNITAVINSTGFNNGTYTGKVRIDSNDLGDTPKYIPVTINVIDITPPILTIVSPSNGTTYNLSWVDLNYSVNEDTLIVNYSLDGKENVTITGNTTLKNLTSDEHNLTVYVQDLGGNLNHSTVYFNVTAPKIQFSPEEINITLSQGNKTDRNITIGNSGLTNLEFNVSYASGGGGAGGPRIGLVREVGYRNYETLLTNLGLDWINVSSSVNATWLIENVDILIQDGCCSGYIDSVQISEYQTFYNQGGTMWISFDDVSENSYEPEMRALIGASDFANSPDYSTITFTSATYPNGEPTYVNGRSLDFGQGDQDVIKPDTCVVLDNYNESTILEGGSKFVMYLGDTIQSVSNLSETGTLGLLFNGFVEMWVNKNVDFLTLTPPNGTVGVESQLNVTATINATGMNNGSYTTRIQIDNTDLDQTPSEVTVNLDVIDITPPIVTIISPSNETTYNMSWVDLKYYVNEDTSVVNYSLDGGANVTLDGNTTLKNQSDGEHNLSVYALDLGGNLNHSTVYFNVAAPRISVLPEEINVTLYHGNITERTVNINNWGEQTLEFNATVQSMDNYTTSATSYEWVEGVTGGKDLKLYDDDYSTEHLPFNFRFYNNSYSKIFVSSNGWVTFDGTNQYPGMIPGGETLPVSGEWFEAIFPLGDDWNPYTGGEVYVKNLTSPNRYVITWYQVPHFPSSGNNTFQAVLYQSGEIRFNYDVVDNPSFPVIGVNKGDGVFGTDYGTTPANETSIILTPQNPTWLNFTPASGTLSASNQANATAIINSAGVKNGSYSADVIINNNDLDKNPTYLKVNIEVIDITPPKLDFITPTPGNGASLSSSTTSVTINVSSEEVGPDTLVLSWNSANETHYYSNGSNAITKSVSDGNSYNFYLWANDTAGNSHQTSTISFSVQSGGSEGGGGGGGGGVVSTSFEVTIKELKKGESFTIDISDADLPYLSGITINAARDTYYAKLSITDLDKKPSGIRDPDADVYTYFKMGYSKPSNYIEKASFRFRIEKSWLREEDIDPLDVEAYRYKNGWEVLDTEPIEEDDEWIYFQAETPGFSYFSMGGKGGTGYKTLAEIAKKEAEMRDFKGPSESTIPKETISPKKTLFPGSGMTTGRSDYTQIYMTFLILLTVLLAVLGGWGVNKVIERPR